MVLSLKQAMDSFLSEKPGYDKRMHGIPLRNYRKRSIKKEEYYIVRKEDILLQYLSTNNT